MPQIHRKQIGVAVLTLILGCTIQGAGKNPLNRLKSAVVIVTTYDDRGRPIAQGSGFFITPNCIVTNLHVINHTNRIKIATWKGETASVIGIIAADANSDLALLRIDASLRDIETLEIERATPVEGEAITVISNPQGSRWKITYGVTGATWSFENAGPRLQITADVRPGSSGGPVLNDRGRVIGIAVMHTGAGENLNFAVPAENLTALKALSDAARWQPSAAATQRTAFGRN